MRVCTNGHQQRDNDSKFCNFCGTVLSPLPIDFPLNPPVSVPNNPPPVSSSPPIPPIPPIQSELPKITPDLPVAQTPQLPPVLPPPPIHFQVVQPPPIVQPPAQIEQPPIIPPISPPSIPVNPPVSPSVPNNFQPPQVNYAPNVWFQNPVTPKCQTCAGDGTGLDEKNPICAECKFIFPLAKGYAVDCSAFQWAEDGKAMAVLRSITPLQASAQTISDKVGRRWIEATFNGILLSEKQLPDVYAQAVKAARIMGMAKMPDIYISGELMWECHTYGSDHDAFIVIGTALVGSFRGDDLLFLLARQMGHCRAGHALWRTVIRFLLGAQGPRRGMMGGGVFNMVGNLLSPIGLIESAIEVPLLSWARQSEITADRAGMLAVGDEEISRRVLLSWSLKSPFLYKQINLESWLKQQEASDFDEMTRLSELTTSATPYITRRLKLMREFAESNHLQNWRKVIDSYVKPPETKNAETPKPKAEASNDLRIKCASCQTPMRVPKKILDGKSQISIKCPKPECKKLTVIKKKPPTSDAKPKPAAMPNKLERELNYAE